MSLFHDEVEIEDFDYDEDTETFTYPCPCGDLFRITRDELEDGEDIARCPSCSLIVRVIYDEADFEEGSDSESDDSDDDKETEAEKKEATSASAPSTPSTPSTQANESKAGGPISEADNSHSTATEELHEKAGASNDIVDDMKRASIDDPSKSGALDFSSVTAVHKEEVTIEMASTFRVQHGIPTGLEPILTDVGLPDTMDAFVIDNVLTATECKMLISAAEHAGLTFWDTTRDTPRKDYRNADTVEVPNLDLATALWSRIKHLVPANISISESSRAREQCDLHGTWEGYNTNEKVLFARYEHGGHFSPHTDGYSIVDFNQRSMYTLLIYLNTCENGGGTRFYKDEQVSKLQIDEQGRFSGQPEYEITTVKAVMGRALCFFHNIVHEGVAVAPGATKYIIRSDLMYRRTPAICDSEMDKQAFALYQEADELSAQGKSEEAMKLYMKCVKLSPSLAAIYGL